MYATAEESTPPAAPEIVPNAVYVEGALRLLLGLTESTMARERREGRLRFVRKGNRILYLGAWVLEWLEACSRAALSGAEAAEVPTP